MSGYLRCSKCDALNHDLNPKTDAIAYACGRCGQYTLYRPVVNTRTILIGATVGAILGLIVAGLAGMVVGGAIGALLDWER